MDFFSFLLQPWRYLPNHFRRARSFRTLGKLKDGFVPIWHPKLKARNSVANPYTPTFRHGDKEPKFFGPAWMGTRKTAHFTREPVPLPFAVVPQYRKYESLLVPPTPFEDGRLFWQSVDRGRAHYPAYQLGAPWYKDVPLRHVERERLRLYEDANVPFAVKAKAIVEYTRAPGRLVQPVRSNHVGPFHANPNDPRTGVYMYIPEGSALRRLHDIRYRFAEHRATTAASTAASTSSSSSSTSKSSSKGPAKRDEEFSLVKEFDQYDPKPPPVITFSSPVDFPNASPPPPHSLSDHSFSHPHDPFGPSSASTPPGLVEVSATLSAAPIASKPSSSLSSTSTSRSISAAAARGHGRAGRDRAAERPVRPLELVSYTSAAGKPAALSASSGSPSTSGPSQSSLLRFREQRVLRGQRRRSRRLSASSSAVASTSTSGLSSSSGAPVDVKQTIASELEVPMEPPFGRDRPVFAGGAPTLMTEDPRPDPWGALNSVSESDLAMDLVKEAYGAKLAEPKMATMKMDPGGAHYLTELLRKHMEDNGRRPTIDEYRHMQWDAQKPIKVYGLTPAFTNHHFGRIPIYLLAPGLPAATSGSTDPFVYAPLGRGAFRLLRFLFPLACVLHLRCVQFRCLYVSSIPRIFGRFGDEQDPSLADDIRPGPAKWRTSWRVPRRPLPTGPIAS